MTTKDSSGTGIGCHTKYHGPNQLYHVRTLLGVGQKIQQANLRHQLEYNSNDR